MSATVRIALLNDDFPLPVLPFHAVVGEGDDAQVFVYHPDTQKVERRQVTTGRLTGQGVEILSGIEAGEQVVAAGVGFLSDGMQVRPDMSVQELR
jgi:multidrug efflux pump subunit AcrA (membrane-fusion protein)